MSFSDDDSLTRLEGGTDGAVIGNIGDALKVSMSAANYDAFSRLRVSTPESLFDSTMEYGIPADLYASLGTTGGTITHDNNKKCAILTATTSAGSNAILQSRHYLKYQPGKSSLVIITGNFKGAVASIEKSFGQFDADNGFYFKLSGLTPVVGLRSSISGSIVNTEITQSNWSIDKLDGTGTSGVTLDFTKQQIMFVYYQWLGAGTIYYGFSVGGALIVCHKINNANILSTLYSQTATLPIRAEIKNISSASSSTIEYTCCTVISEGGWTPKGSGRSINYGTTAGKTFAAVNNRRPIISIRKQAAYYKMPVELLDMGVFLNTADDFIVELVGNPTLTGASWTNVEGFCQRDIAATALSGGSVLYSFYVRGGASADSTAVHEAFDHVVSSVIGCDLAGASDILSLVGTALTSSSTIMGYMNYKEMY